MRLFSSIVLLLIAIASLTGCESTAVKPVTANDPYYAPAVPTMTRDEIVEDGSLFNKAMANSLYSDVKARRIGDIITVRLSENTNASKSAGTSTSKESTVDVNPIIGLGGNVINIGKESIQLLRM